MKIFDCFLFFNELELLELRLKIAYDYVDKFIIVESDKTFTNKSKGYILEKSDILKKYGDKIIYYKMTFSGDNAWHNEFAQRDALRFALSSYPEDDDMVIISDLDEIPKYDDLINLSNDKCYRLEMDLFYYSVNNKIDKKIWNLPVFVPFKKLKKNSPESLRNNHKIKYKSLKNMGFHFSYLFGNDYEKYIKKIKSFSHTELNLRKFTNIEKLKERVLMRKDLYDRDVYDFVLVDFDTYFPELITKHKEYILQQNWIF